MSYPGVPSELTKKMDTCVSKLVTNGKGKPEAISLCKTSILSQKELKKEKPWKVVENKEDRFLFFSQESIEKKRDVSKNGTLVKDVEIFKSGTYRGIQFKNSALDKMVANFNYLKSFNIFGNVPVRADHPGFFSGGEIDKVGGYIDDLKRVGNKLVADFRITSDKMMEKIKEGTYVNRSAEIGNYDDNNGTLYEPTLFGVAFVDIPQVEGLSPKFTYSKDNQKLINLNNINPMGEENKEVPTGSEEEQVEEKEEVSEEEEQKEEVSEEEETEEEEKEEEEEQKEEVVEEAKSEFAKSFPNEYAKLEKLSVEKFDKDFESLVKAGKMTPAMLDAEKVFAKTLSEVQLKEYFALKEKMPKLVELNKEEEGTDESEKPEEKEEEGKDSDKKADEFIKEADQG